MTMHPYERYNKIEGLLRREALSLSEIAAELDIPVSTIRRDVLVLITADQVERLGVTLSGAATYRATVAR